MHPNLVMIETVARRLGATCDECVFVGGATVPLFLTDPAAPAPRSTRDVDIIVELATRPAYYRFAQKLRELGFEEDAAATILCRWRVADLIVDVMPTNEEILGFSNRWYATAIQTAQLYALTPHLQIRLVLPAYFIATKIEAFAGRGQGDFLDSRDMEDIITLLDGRAEIGAEIAAADPALRAFVATQFTQWLLDDGFTDALPGHLLPDAASQARLPLLIQRIQAIADLVSAAP